MQEYTTIFVPCDNEQHANCTIVFSGVPVDRAKEAWGAVRAAVRQAFDMPSATPTPTLRGFQMGYAATQLRCLGIPFESSDLVFDPSN